MNVITVKEMGTMALLSNIKAQYDGPGAKVHDEENCEVCRQFSTNGQEVPASERNQQ